MNMGDYDELAARSFDEPYDAELRESMLVCADALGQANDPRGPLITMEHALLDAEPRRAFELRRAMHQHVLDHGASLLGAVASLLSFKRALELEWRSGRIYGVTIDTRYLSPKAGISPAELVKVFVKVPATSHLRRLRVRVRKPEHVAGVVTMLGKRKHPRPLEELEIGGRVWPSQIAEEYEPTAAREKLREKYPNLYFLALEDSIVPLPIAAKRKPKQQLADVLLVDPPTTVAPRVMLGRALCAHDPDLREAALQRIAGIGQPAVVFARVMRILMQPRVVTPQLPIVAALRALGPGRDTMTALARVSSRVAQYDVETRRAAGAAAAELRAGLVRGVESTRGS